MARELRLVLYFCIGLLLGSIATFANAAAWSNMGGNTIIARTSSGLPVTLRFPDPVLSNVGTGWVLAKSNAGMNMALAAGARVPVTVPLTATKLLSPALIARALVFSPQVQAGITALAVIAPLLQQAAVTYEDGHWLSKSVGPEQPVKLYIYNTLNLHPSYVGATPLEACAKRPMGAGFVDAGTTWTTPSDGTIGCNAKEISTGIVYTGGPLLKASYCPSKGIAGLSYGTLVCTGSPTGSNGPISDADAEGLLTPIIQNHADPLSIVNALPPSAIPDPQNAQITGPSSVQSPSITTTNTTNNTTTTTTYTTVNNTYNNNSVTSTVTNHTVTKNAAGEIISSSSEGATPDPNKDDNAVVVDTAMPELPKLYERKYPDGLQGVWRDNIAAIKATPLFSLPQIFAPTAADSGSCPNWSFNANIGPNMNFGSGSISPPCYIWPILKTIMIIGALLLARALVFGG